MARKTAREKLLAHLEAEKARKKRQDEEFEKKYPTLASFNKQGRKTLMDEFEELKTKWRLEDESERFRQGEMSMQEKTMSNIFEKVLRESLFDRTFNYDQQKFDEWNDKIEAFDPNDWIDDGDDSGEVITRYCEICGEEYDEDPYEMTGGSHNECPNCAEMMEDD